jgi:hypothetical protein
MSFNKALNDEEVFSEMRKMVKNNKQSENSPPHHLQEETKEKSAL